MLLIKVIMVVVLVVMPFVMGKVLLTARREFVTGKTWEGIQSVCAVALTACVWYYALTSFIKAINAGAV